MWLSHHTPYYSQLILLGLCEQNMGFPYLQRRSELVSSIMRMAQTFGLRQEVAHDAILLMDRAMSTSLQVFLHLKPAVSPSFVRKQVMTGIRLTG